MKHLMIYGLHNSFTQNMLTKRIEPNENLTIIIVPNQNGSVSADKANSRKLVLDALRNHKEPVDLITFVIDFNLGYSGENISPINYIKESIEAISRDDGLSPYKIANKSSEIEILQKVSLIPVRMVLVGSGGSKPREELFAGDMVNGRSVLCEMLATDIPLHSFNGWTSQMNLIAEFRANGGLTRASSSSSNSTSDVREPMPSPVSTMSTTSVLSTLSCMSPGILPVLSLSGTLDNRHFSFNELNRGVSTCSTTSNSSISFSTTESELLSPAPIFTSFLRTTSSVVIHQSDRLKQPAITRSQSVVDSDPVDELDELTSKLKLS